MAHAMTPGLSSSFAQHVPERPLHEAKNGFGYLYQAVPTGLQVTALRGDERAVGVIEWVLGAGHQGQTPLVRVKDTLFESRVSYFPQMDQFGITIGQPGGASLSAQDALGLKESHKDARSCLMCHATGVTEELVPVVAGVQCERCHEGAAEHAASHGSKPVVNPGKLAAMDQVRLCGTCHRITPPVDEGQIENVRFQPLRLIKSKCFGSGKLECTTCHVAHQDARRDDAAFYNSKCDGCHGAGMGAGQHSDVRRSGNCVGCHMPVVQLHPALKFTDHYIR